MAKHDKPRTPQRARAETLARQALFLQQYAGIGVISSAARLAGISRSEHYAWLALPKKYLKYAKQFEDAHEQACDRLETEMVRRGLHGWDEPVYGKLPGKDTGTGQVGLIRKYSDRMLEIALKACRPDRFRERYEHTGPGNTPLTFTINLARPNADI